MPYIYSCETSVKINFNFYVCTRLWNDSLTGKQPLLCNSQYTQRPGQTDATFCPNIVQHCWIMLRYVAYLSDESGQTDATILNFERNMTWPWWQSVTCACSTATMLRSSGQTIPCNIGNRAKSCAAFLVLELDWSQILRNVVQHHPKSSQHHPKREHNINSQQYIGLCCDKMLRPFDQENMWPL